MGWSPNDKKIVLLEECLARGIEVPSHCFKSDLIRLLQNDDLKESEKQLERAMLGIQEEEPVSQEPPHELSEPDPPMTPTYQGKMDSGQAQSLEQAILNRLSGSKERIPLARLLREFGSDNEALMAIKELVKKSKVTQYKQHNNFWYKAR